MANPEAQAQAGAPAAVELNEFEALLNKEFKAKDTQKQSAVQTAVRTLAEQALSQTSLVSDDVVKSIEAIIAEIDKKLSEQINKIMHHEDFKKLEGTWRGLHHLVNNTETDEMLKIRVFNISKKEVGATVKKFKGTARDQSPLLKKLYEDEFGSPGGQPYGAKTNPVEDFAFEEDTEGADHNKYVWSNAAYAMGTNITRSFKLYGWCSRIRGAESGGMLEGLPCHTFPTDDGGVDMKCPTEIAITDRREAELAKNGMMPLSHWKNTDYAVFVGAQSLQKPAAYDDADATANANLAARLPYLFATCRFAHYLKCIVRDKIGSFKEREDMQAWLTKWIKNYVVSSPTASEVDKARCPLAAAEVVVEEVKGNPGYYTSKFFLRPHYQLEGLTVSLRLVSKLPSVKGG